MKYKILGLCALGLVITACSDITKAKNNNEVTTITGDSATMGLKTLPAGIQNTNGTTPTQISTTITLTPTNGSDSCSAFYVDSSGNLQLATSGQTETDAYINGSNAVATVTCTAPSDSVTYNVVSMIAGQSYVYSGTLTNTTTGPTFTGLRYEGISLFAEGNDLGGRTATCDFNNLNGTPPGPYAYNFWGTIYSDVPPDFSQPGMTNTILGSGRIGAVSEVLNNGTGGSVPIPSGSVTCSIDGVTGTQTYTFV